VSDFLVTGLFDAGGYLPAAAGSAATITAVPEPSTYALLARAGAGAAGYLLRRKRR
jgi:hypothetical protein